ncbi:MAG: Holliday junction branch migration protein RuvA [Candidatus Delongbacteria bacterium]|nr:Holliday junction branch migration protein RuvA [Candidatus Delongbacteria bacterium]
MIAYLKGILKEKKPTLAVIEAGQIGYSLNISVETSRHLPELEQSMQLYTYLHVKEDGITLYGFYTRAEREAFLKLIGVSGIGPKSAQTILSSVSPQDLKHLIQTEDLAKLSSIHGIGKKTSARLIVELKDSWKHSDEDEIRIPGIPASPISQAGILEEAELALISLGLAKNQAEKKIQAVIKKYQPATLEEIITKALQE